MGIADEPIDRIVQVAARADDCVHTGVAQSKPVSEGERQKRGYLQPFLQ
jgi:hypothetical protein